MKVTKRTWTTESGASREAWVVRYYHEGKYRLKTFEHKRNAEAWAAQMKVDQKNGIHRPDSTSLTIRQLWPLLLETCEAEQLEPEVIDKYETLLRIHIFPAETARSTLGGWNSQLGDLKLSKLNTPICEILKRILLKAKTRTWKGKVTDRTVSRRTAGHALATFKRLLNDAQTRGLIAYNPALPVRIGEKQRDRAPLRIGDQIPDRPEVHAIIAASAGMWRALLKTAAFTGMRSSELRGWRRTEARLKRRSVEVCERADRTGKIGACKSKSGYRTIQIGDDLVDELQDWLEICPSSALGLVFPGKDGKVLPVGMILKELCAIQMRIGMVRPGPDGIPRPKYNLHSFRHFYASILIDEGTPQKRLQELLGHSSLAMTMDLYGHLFPPTSDETDRINKAMAKVFEDAAD